MLKYILLSTMVTKLHYCGCTDFVPLSNNHHFLALGSSNETSVIGLFHCNLCVLWPYLELCPHYIGLSFLWVLPGSLQDMISIVKQH